MQFVAKSAFLHVSARMRVQVQAMLCCSVSALHDFECSTEDLLRTTHYSKWSVLVVRFSYVDTPWSNAKIVLCSFTIDTKLSQWFKTVLYSMILKHVLLAMFLGKICMRSCTRLTTHCCNRIHTKTVKAPVLCECVIHYIAVWFSSQKKRSCCRNSVALGLSSTIAFQKHLRRFCCCHVAVVLGTHGNGPYVGMDEKTKWRLHTMY